MYYLYLYMHFCRLIVHTLLLFFFFTYLIVNNFNFFVCVSPIGSKYYTSTLQECLYYYWSLFNLFVLQFWIWKISNYNYQSCKQLIVFKDSEALPVTRQSTRFTRSLSSNAITYIPKRNRTVTYQRSYFIRACHTWNVLPTELPISHISLASFKRLLLQYYNRALDLYDVDKPGE